MDVTWTWPVYGASSMGTVLTAPPASPAHLCKPDRVDIHVAACVGGCECPEHWVVGVPLLDGSILEAECAAGCWALNCKVLGELCLDEPFTVSTLCWAAGLNGIDFVTVPEHQHLPALDIKLLADTCVEQQQAGQPESAAAAGHK